MLLLSHVTSKNAPYPEVHFLTLLLPLPSASTSTVTTNTYFVTISPALLELKLQKQQQITSLRNTLPFWRKSDINLTLKL